MTLFNYYKKAALYPSIIALAVISVISILDNRDYKSEWMTADMVILTIIIAAFIYCLIFCFVSLTIFLNKFDSVKENAFFNFLSWFLLPLGFMAVVFVHEINLFINGKDTNGEGYAYLLIVNLPLFFGLLRSYLRYKKNNRSRKP
jgi:hypothetical protein